MSKSDANAIAVPSEPTRDPVFVSSAVAAISAGAVAGFLSGCLFAAVEISEKITGANLVSVPIIGLSVALMGAGVALLPGLAVGAAIQKIRRVDLAPMIGAVTGAALLVAGYGLLSSGAVGDRTAGFVGLGVCGLVGGAVGGVVLQRMQARSLT